MKDNQVRGLILQQLYSARHESHFVDIPDDLNLPQLDPQVIGNVAQQLDEQHLIQFSQVMGKPYPSGHARILSYGVDVVEGTAQAAISIKFDQSVNVQHSQNVQVGQGNVQNTSGVEHLSIAIDNADASHHEKEAAKSLLAKISENKLLITILKKFGLSIS